ncbi:MAG TPA: hypothetical protein VJ032_12555, partial [Thermoanaerobaculia bacterium]|nr:hypothetical protein [Thermoanaerobaculia bacterium]
CNRDATAGALCFRALVNANAATIRREAVRGRPANERSGTLPLTVAARERGRFSSWLQKRFSLRIHMSLILLATITAGVVATHLMIEVHLNRLWLRYAIAVLFAYGAFLLLVKFWLFYLGMRAQRERDRLAIDCPIDMLDAVCHLGDFGDIAETAIDEAGGRFGGGGSSGSWPEPSVSSSISAPAPSGGGGGGFGLDLDLDDGVLLLAIAVVLAIVIACVYLIYAAPAILSEAAFEAALGAALLKKARSAASGNWVGSIVKSTILPFLVIAALSTTLGWYAQSKCPAATRLHDALFCAKTSGMVSETAHAP